MNSIWAGQIHLLKCTFFEISHEKVSYPVPPKYRTPHSMQSFIPMCTYAMQLEIVDPLAFSLPLSSLSLYISFFNPSENEPGRQKEKCVPKRDCILIATSLLPGLLIFSLWKKRRRSCRPHVAPLCLYGLVFNLSRKLFDGLVHLC